MSNKNTSPREIQGQSSTLREIRLGTPLLENNKLQEIRNSDFNNFIMISDYHLKM